MDWHSDNNFTLSRAGSPHRSEDNSNFENNDAASVFSDRVDIYSDRFSDLEENFMDFSDGDLDLDSQSSELDDRDSTGDNAGTELMDVEQDEAFSGSELPSVLSTPALDCLKAKLLGNYKCPACYDLSLVMDTSIIPSSLSQLFPFPVISLYDLSTTRLLSLTLSLTLRLRL